MDNNQLNNRTEPVQTAIAVKEETPNNVNGLAVVRSTKETTENKFSELNLKKPLVLNNLAGYLRRVWSSCRDGRSEITRILEECKRARNGEYDPDILATLKAQGGSTSYHNITNHKCASAEGWINEMASTEDPWSISPTPVPEINPDMYEQIAVEVADVAEEYQKNGQPLEPDDVIAMAEETRLEYDKTIRDITNRASENMTRIMRDQLLDGQWKIAFREFVRDFVTYPIGIMKFEIKREVTTAFKEDENGNWIIATEPVLRETWRRVNPFNFYPAPNIADVEDGDVCEKISFTRKQLVAMIGVEGYNDNEIRAVLEEYGKGGLEDWSDGDFYDLNYELGKEASLVAGMSSTPIDAVEFHGSVQGSMLQEWGMKGVKDSNAEYDIWAILIGTHVIMAQLNPNPLGRKPYQTCSYERDPDSIWGRGIAQKVRQSQLDANQNRRALLNNISLSSGPQVMVNQSLLSPTEDITAMYPYKIWKMRRSKQNEVLNVTNAFHFFQPTSHSQELMSTLQFFANEADEDSGIPKVAEGSISNSYNNAASTASGLSMILDNASRNLRNVIGNIDTYIIQKQIEDLYMLNMLDPNIPNDAKGDLVVKARGILSTGLRDKLQVLRKDFMLMILGNEMLTSIVGVDGIADLLREISKPLEMPPDFVPSSNSIEHQQKQQEQEQQQQTALALQVLQLAVEKGFDAQQAEQIRQQLTGGQPAPQQQQQQPQQG